MLKHIVIWKLHEEAEGAARAENIQTFKNMLEALVGQIPQIVDFEVGLNEKDAEPACHLSLVSSFNNLEDLAIYAAHPEHQKLIKWAGKVVSERHVVDYHV